MGKYYYKIYGLNIDSDYRLKNVIKLDKIEHVDVEIIAMKLPDKIVDVQESEIERGHGWVYHLEKTWGFVRFVNYGSFLIEEGSKISYQLKGTYNEFYVSEIISCLCLNIIMMQRGTITFHGSCVERKEKGIIISGDSGAGKSTITTELIESGSSFLSDDIVPVTVEHDVSAWASYPQRKLCEDVINKKKVDKKRISVFQEDNQKDKYAINQSEDFRTEPIKLDWMYILKVEDCEQIKIEEITGSDKLKYIINSIFGRTYYNYMGFGMEQMKKAIKIAEAIKVCVITRPANIDTSKEIVDIIDRSIENDMVMTANQ